jgi:mRNA interferase MazF
MADIPASSGTGLKTPSVVRFDKLATLDKQTISGKLGNAPMDWLVAHAAKFFGVFGFSQLASSPLP